MKTFDQLAKEYLTPPEYERFRVNIGLKINQHSYNEESFIDKAFIWKNQPEGDGYWRKLSRELNEKIRQGILRVSD